MILGHVFYQGYEGPSAPIALIKVEEKSGLIMPQIVFGGLAEFGVVWKGLVSDLAVFIGA